MQTFQPISEKSSNACICSDTAVAVCCRYAKMQALHNACIWKNTGVTYNGWIFGPKKTNGPLH
jgi:hypothetical protein